MPINTFDQVLDAIEELPAEEQLELLNVVRQRLAERGRRRVINDVAQAELEFHQGFAKPASVEEIMGEIES